MGAAAILGVSLIAARLAFPLPKLVRADDAMAQPAGAGVMAAQALASASGRDGQSGLHLLSQSDAAFAARMALARSAAATIDVQYYIWHNDLTGLLLLDELRKAADRGVAVRLLLDDNGIPGLDPVLAELDRHPNIAIRLYNPFTVRGFKQAGYAFDFLRLNRRMHNKSFTVDGVATIGGGRNIGDEYFGTASVSNYVDLDILLVGHVVEAVSRDFATYWNSGSSYPLTSILGKGIGGPGMLDTALAGVLDDPRLPVYRAQIERNEAIVRMVEGSLPLEWAVARLVSDPPGKTLGKAKDAQLLTGQFQNLLGQVTRQLDIVSPYFVPGEKGTRMLTDLARQGVKVRVLTNAQEATDVLPVHAGYAKYRRQLLEGGVELYELKAGSAPKTKRSDAGPLGSSSASLHAKTFAVDGREIYVGSFNFDPRSVALNTEMGFLIQSERIAQDVHAKFGSDLAGTAYALSLDERGNIRWVDQSADGRRRVFSQDPNTSPLSRAAVRVIGWLPVQSLL